MYVRLLTEHVKATIVRSDALSVLRHRVEHITRSLNGKQVSKAINVAWSCNKKVCLSI